MAPPATVDTVIFLARTVGSPIQSDEGRLELTVIRPNLMMAKAVNPPGMPLPGTELTYTATVTNAGNAPASGLAVLDSIPPELEFKVGTATDSLPAGLSTLIEYSNDGGASWTYAPISGGCGAPVDYDACVTHLRWTFLNDLGHVAPDNAGILEFVARLK